MKSAHCSGTLFSLLVTLPLAGVALFGCGGDEGPAGERGAEGEPGTPGTDGTDGTGGVDGDPGLPGAPGVDGEDGEMGPPGPAPTLVPAYEQPTYAYYSAEWWRWAASMPAGDGHPLFDETGDDCGVGQGGPVWFLGGGFDGDDIDADDDGEVDGTLADISRACTVPAGKAILIPIVNILWNNIGEDPQKTDEELMDNARTWADAARGLSAEIDGVAVGSLDDYRFATDVFDFDYVADSPISAGFPDGTSNAAADGHWLLLNPLSPGTHTIHTVGSYVFTTGGQGFDWVLQEDVTYTLTVAEPVVPYAPDATIEGQTYAQWAADWWQFMMAVETDANPIRDTTGEHCADGQEGRPVFFLAGAGSADPVARACEIPADTSLFFPLINYLDDHPCPDPDFGPADGQTLEAFLTADAAGILDNVTEVTCEVDGVEIPDVFRNFRTHSALFDFTGDISWQEFDGCVTGDEQQGLTDGWWMALPPLSAGTHTIHFTGSAPAIGFGQDVTYTLTVN